jgi:hypothetical protein
MSVAEPFPLVSHFSPISTRLGLPLEKQNENAGVRNERGATALSHFSLLSTHYSGCPHAFP